MSARLRLRAIVGKELRQIRRDVRTLLILLVIPGALITLVGYAVSLDVKHIRCAIVDDDNSAESREFVSSLGHSEYFDLVSWLRSAAEAGPELDAGRAAAALVINRGFGADVLGNREAKVQVLLDGSNGSAASTALVYIEAAINAYGTRIRMDALTRLGANPAQPVDFRPRVWYNPELRSARFLLPGLIGYILMITAVVATSLSIVREKERGTMEQIVVSPVTPLELVAGKLLPYLAISFVSALALLAVSWLIFDTSVRGSFLLLCATIALYLANALAIGLFISTITDSQQVAFTVATFVSTLPTMMLSGFIFPIRAMPVALQVLTNVTPAKFFVHSIRGIMIKGVGLEAMWDDWLIMALFAAGVVALSTMKMRRPA
jgi:ABC-2 type transport system permease protein